MGELVISSVSDKDLLSKNHLAVATFCGGCFWCTQGAYRALPGVISVFSGYAGGNKLNPSYDEVHDERFGFREAVQIIFDPNMVSYEKLLTIFLQNIDPTDATGQFFDRGFCYTTAICYHDKQQKLLAHKALGELSSSKKFSKPLVTLIIPFKNFFKAEEYQQDFDMKNPFRYKAYKLTSGRVGFLKKLWG